MKNRQEILRRSRAIILRIAFLAVSAFLLSSSAWASTSNCSNQTDSTDGCSTTTQQFVNIFTVGNLGFQNTNVFAYQQTANSPCIYDNSSCNNAGFPSVLLSGDANKDNVFSQEYTAQTLLDVLKVPAFFVGVDVNSTGDHGTETLTRFDMFVNGVLAFSLPAGSYPMLVGNNPGNGYSDNLITGFSLAGLNSTDIVQFVMSEHFDVGGREQFFLIADVPEPATFWLMGGALALLGLFAWSRNKTVRNKAVA
jgi:hypothetical protein